MTSAAKSPNSIDTNDPIDYITSKNAYDYDEYGDKRFVKFEEREFRSDVSDEMMKHYFHGKYLTRWCSIPLMKGPFDIIMYQQMLQYIRPRTIIETGTWTGASAAWFGDLAKMFGLDCHVYSMDITNPGGVDKTALRDNVTYLHGDNNKIEETFTPDMLKSLPHPWIFSEDAHVNVIPVMEYFTKYLQPGDYFVLEDLAPNMCLKSGMGLVKELGWEPFGDEAYKELEVFMKSNSEKYLVDRLYCDMFGYNGHVNWNGVLKRV